MKRRTLALILAAALTVTSVEGTAVMASAAEFTSEAAEEEENTGQESETDTFSSDFAEQEGEIASEEIGITDEETQEEEARDKLSRTF